MSERPRHVSRAPAYVVIVFFVVALTLVFVGAQRSSEEPPAPVVASAGTAANPRPVNVIMRDYLFDPRPIVLVPGETVRFTIIDAGTLPHEFALGDQSVQDAWEAADAAATPPGAFATAPPASVPAGTGGVRILLDPGQEASVDYTVPATGTLQLLCHLPGHIEHGMIGQLQLQAGGPTPTAPR